ncbi:hypothetical protein [Methanobrevibacter sp. UBA188]|uniref:hypothetical protein n=1 Tax=Methanobrevibacter sp. UBA188 TaxID=1915473 RepID=UPI0025D94A3E|nr:hypothetical protein [Methanobrevibacter sp. UBA188]
MGQEIEEIKKIILKYDPTIKEKLEEGLVDSKSIYDLEEFLNEIINNVLTKNVDTMDLILIVEQLDKLEKKKMMLLKESEEAGE